MSTLKVDAIAANSAATISIASPLAVNQTASVTGTLSTAAISSTGTISTTGELDGATLDISGNGDLAGQLSAGSLLVQGNLSTSGILVDGEEMRPHVFAFGSFSGSTLSGAKNCTAVIDSSGTLAVTFATNPPDTSYVVLSSTKDQASQVEVSSKTATSFEITNVPSAGVDFLVVALLGSQGTVTAALPSVSLDNLSDVDLTGLDDNEVLVYDAASGKFKPEAAATGSGSVTQIVAGTGLTGGTINSSGTIAHQAVPTTGLTSVGFPSAISIDPLGHVASLTGDTNANDARDTLGLGDSATKAVGNSSGTVCAGDDSRLSNARTPTAHTQALSTITDAGTSASLDVASSGDATSSQVVKGNDTRLSDDRPPTTTLEHDANKITTGQLPAARGGTGLSSISTLLNSNQAYSDISGTPTLGTAAAAATGDFVASSAVSTFGGTLIDDGSAADARTTLGGTTVGSNVFTAADQAAARSAIGVGTGTGDMVGSNNLSEITSESTARTNLGLGTAATSATGDFVAATAVSTFGGTLIDDATVSDARTTLGLGTAATTDATSYAGAIHTHTLANITDSGTAAASDTTDFVAASAVSTFGASLVDDADASAARSTLGLGTVATTDATAYAAAAHSHTLANISDAGTAAGSATGDFVASSAVSTFGGTLIDDGSAADARTTLGLGTVATTDATAYAPAVHVQSASTITTGELAVARGGTGSATAPMIAVVTAADAAAARSVLGAGTGNGDLLASNNLSDVTAATARTNLGITNTGSYTGHIETAADKTYVLDPSAATDRTISAFYIKVNSGSGTVSATLKVGTSTVKTVTASTSTAAQTGLHPGASAVTAGDAITLVFASNSSATDVIFSVEYTE